MSQVHALTLAHSPTGGLAVRASLAHVGIVKEEHAHAAREWRVEVDGVGFGVVVGTLSVTANTESGPVIWVSIVLLVLGAESFLCGDETTQD